MIHSQKFQLLFKLMNIIFHILVLIFGLGFVHSKSLHELLKYGNMINIITLIYWVISLIVSLLYALHISRMRLINYMMSLENGLYQHALILQICSTMSYWIIYGIDEHYLLFSNDYRIEATVFFDILCSGVPLIFLILDLYFSFHYLIFTFVEDIIVIIAIIMFFTLIDILHIFKYHQPIYSFQRNFKPLYQLAVFIFVLGLLVLLNYGYRVLLEEWNRRRKKGIINAAHFGRSNIDVNARYLKHIA